MGASAKLLPQGFSLQNLALATLLTGQCLFFWLFERSAHQIACLGGGFYVLWCKLHRSSLVDFLGCLLVIPGC